MNSQVTVSLDSAQASWHDSGMVLAAGWGLAITTTGTATLATGLVHNTDGSIAINGAAGSPVVGYPEGYYQEATPLIHAYQPWRVSLLNTGRFAGSSTPVVCANLPPYCVAVLVQADGAAAPSSTSVTGALNAFRQRQFSSGELGGGAGGRVWLLYNDAASDRANNVGSFFRDAGKPATSLLRDGLDARGDAGVSKLAWVYNAHAGSLRSRSTDGRRSLWIHVPRRRSCRERRTV